MLINLPEADAMNRVFPLCVCPPQSWPQPPVAVAFHVVAGSMSEHVHEQDQLFLPPLLYLQASELHVLHMHKNTSNTSYKVQREKSKVHSCLSINWFVCIFKNALCEENLIVVIPRIANISRD